MYQKIMVPLDGSELAECVLAHAEAIAKGCQTPIELVRVVEPIELPTRGGLALTSDDLRQIELQAKHEAEVYLEEVTNRLSHTGLNIKSKVITGKPADSLIDYARSSHADLIIMATHGRSGISRWIWGSVAQRIISSSSIPVLLVRPPGCVPGVCDTAVSQ